MFCGSGGVEPQSETNWRYANNSKVSRLIFVNKLDRMGADPWSAIYSAREKLGICCAAVQVPIGEDERMRGLIDIVNHKAYFFDGANGEIIREEPVP